MVEAGDDLHRGALEGADAGAAWAEFLFERVEPAVVGGEEEEGPGLVGRQGGHGALGDGLAEGEAEPGCEPETEGAGAFVDADGLPADQAADMDLAAEQAGPRIRAGRA